jgi:hypothetical protein
MADDNIKAVRRYLKQKAVYWDVTDFDGNGKPIFDQPIEIKCRWEDKGEQYVGRDGHDHVSNSVVMVDRDLMEQGVLWLGKLEDVQDQMEPLKNEGAYEIKKKEKIPDRKATKFFRRVYL